MSANFLHSLAIKYPFLKKAFKPLLLPRQYLNQQKLKWQKDIIHRFGSFLTEDPIVHLEEFDGNFAVDVRSALFSRLLTYNCYEPELVALCKKFIDPNKDVIDVGANIGYFSIMFAKQIQDHKVLAVEPTPNALKRLYRNIELNGVKGSIEVIEAVASTKKEMLTMKTIAGKEEYSSIGHIDHPSVRQEDQVSIEVKSVILDEVVEERALQPGFVKVDVEGSENLVFKGSNNLLANHRPVILSELSDPILRAKGSSAQEVIHLIEKHDYAIFNPNNPSSQAGTSDYEDIFCIPKERKPTSKDLII